MSATIIQFPRRQPAPVPKRRRKESLDRLLSRGNKFVAADPAACQECPLVAVFEHLMADPAYQAAKRARELAE